MHITQSKARQLQDADHAASDASSGVPSLLRVWMISSAEVISHSVKNYSPAQDIMWTFQSNNIISEVDIAELFRVELNVTKISYVTVLVLRVPMIFLLNEKLKTFLKQIGLMVKKEKKTLTFFSFYIFHFIF